MFNHLCVTVIFNHNYFRNVHNFQYYVKRVPCCVVDSPCDILIGCLGLFWVLVVIWCAITRFVCLNARNYWCAYAFLDLWMFCHIQTHTGVCRWGGGGNDTLVILFVLLLMNLESEDLERSRQWGESGKDLILFKVYIHKDYLCCGGN